VPAFPYLLNGTIFRFNVVTIGMIILSGLIVLLILRLALRNMDMRHPKGLQNIMEWGVEFTANMARQTMPAEQLVQWVLPLAFTMLTFLFVANWLGVIMTISLHVGHPVPWLGITKQSLIEGKYEVPLFDSPTANMSMTLGMAVMVWIISHAEGLRRPKAWLKHYRNPMFILEEFTNPLTHGLRLYGNIFAGEALIGVLVSAPFLFGWLPWTLPLLLVWLFYCAFVSTIQAYVFTILMTLYIGHKSYRYAHDH
jgi:F-type H+-transporting ATPase subunit a